MKAKQLLPLLLVPFCCLATSCQEERLESKENVIALFQSKGSRDEGDFRFRNLNSGATVSTLETFVYSPVYDSFNCSCLVGITEGDATSYYYGSMSFYWGDQEETVFAGRKEIGNEKSITFLFTPKSKDDSNLSDDYDAVVAEDVSSFGKEEKQEAEAKTYACIQRGIEFAKRILSENGLKSALW